MLAHYEETRKGSEKNQKRNREQMRKETRAYLHGEVEATTCSNGGVWFACGKQQGEDEEESFFVFGKHFF